MKKTIDDIKLQGKKVLLRVDFNVPIINSVITSEKRIDAALPTIKKIISDGGKTIILSHLGRISSQEDVQKNSLKIVAEKLSEKLNKDVKFINSTRGSKVEEAIEFMNNGDLIMLQNTRYEDLNGNLESTNDPELGKYWASLGDVFINDAFGAVHRCHASNAGIAKNIKESGLGYLIQKEIEMLDKGLKKPVSPFVAIIGGAKVSDKIAVIKNLIHVADKILIGGGMSYTFQKARGYEIGESLVENSYIELSKDLLDKWGDKIVLPIDCAITKGFGDNPRKVTKSIDVPKDYMSLDLGDKSIELYRKEIVGSKTVFWNGPMGVSEFENFKQGTEGVCKAIAEQEGVFSIIGGGDSAAAAIKLGFSDKFTHISTGGGASLAYLENKVLPGIDTIQDKAK